MGLSPIKITERLSPVGTVEHRIQTAMQQHWNAARGLGIRHLGGRPTKYRRELAGLAYTMLVDRRVVSSIGYIATVFGVSRSTFYEWMRRYPECKQAVAMGKAFQEEWLANCLVRGIGNQQGIMLLLCRLHGWSHDPQKKRKPVDIVQLVIERSIKDQSVDWERSIKAGSSGRDASIPISSPDRV